MKNNNFIIILFLSSQVLPKQERERVKKRRNRASIDPSQRREEKIKFSLI